MMLDIDTQEQNKLEGTQLALESRLKTQCVDLASVRVAGETLSCSDDFSLKWKT
ncbi:MAG: allantoicase [Cognaticolwellia sp.]|jgi:allantoicase